MLDRTQGTLVAKEFSDRHQLGNNSPLNVLLHRLDLLTIQVAPGDISQHLNFHPSLSGGQRDLVSTCVSFHWQTRGCCPAKKYTPPEGGEFRHTIRLQLTPRSSDVIGEIVPDYQNITTTGIA